MILFAVSIRSCIARSSSSFLKSWNQDEDEVKVGENEGTENSSTGSIPSGGFHDITAIICVHDGGQGSRYSYKLFGSYKMLLTPIFYTISRLTLLYIAVWPIGGYHGLQSRSSIVILPRAVVQGRKLLGTAFVFTWSLRSQFSAWSLMFSSNASSNATRLFSARSLASWRSWEPEYIHAIRCACWMLLSLEVRSVWEPQVVVWNKM